MRDFEEREVRLNADGDNPGITYETIAEVVTSVLAQFSAANIVAMLAGIIGGTIGIRFLWWGVRKAFKSIMGVVTGGRLKV